MTAAAALEESHEEWRADALATIISLARKQSVVTADDLNRELRRPPHCNMIGAAFRAAKNAGYIEVDGFAVSASRSRRQGILREWRGTWKCYQVNERATS